jgi:hypothetical protein
MKSNARTPKNTMGVVAWSQLGLLGAALALRIILACHGGQQFWPDEGRFETARQAARWFLAGQFRSGSEVLFAHADHLAFKILAVIPALVEQAAYAPLWVPALFFAAASAWVIWLVGRVARAAGADDIECLLATLLSASTNALFYYARSFFPYDLSLGFFLTSLLCALPSAPRFRRSLAVGLWAGLGFVTYNGYWTLAVLVVALHTLSPPHSWRSMLAHAGGAMVGLALPVAALLLAGGLLGFNLVASFRRFAGTVTEGNFGVAWRFVGEYFWAAEHGLALVWGAAVAAALVAWVARRAPTRTQLWLAASLLLYAILVVPSDVVLRFTVTARHVRVLAPFLCLLLASLLAELWRSGRKGRIAVVSISGAVVLQAAFNFSTPLRQIYPPEFYRLAVEVIRRALHSDAVPYGILNCYFLHNPDWAVPTPVTDEVVFQRPHPFAFTPFLFEGYNEASRAAFLRRNLSMRVVRVTAHGPSASGYPGVVRMTLRLPDFPNSQPEPLVTTGASGRGDVLFLRPEGGDQVRLGLDHWGSPPIVSEPLRFDRAQPHVLVIAMGSLLPPAKDPFFHWRPDWGALKHRLFVSCDGRTVLDVPAAFHEVEPSTITFGLNLIGASTAIPALSATIVSFARLSPTTILPPVAGEPAAAGFPGVIRMTLRFRDSYTGWPEPLVSSGVTARGDVLFLRYEDPGHIRIGLDHWGGPPIVSAPLPIDCAQPHVFVIAMGSLFPPENDPFYQQHPEWRIFKHHLYVTCDGRAVLDTPAVFHDATPATITFGLNLIGASTAIRELTADVSDFGYLQPSAVRPQLGQTGPLPDSTIARPSSQAR